MVACRQHRRNGEQRRGGEALAGHNTALLWGGDLTAVEWDPIYFMRRPTQRESTGRPRALLCVHGTASIGRERRDGRAAQRAAELTYRDARYRRYGSANTITWKCAG